MGKDIKGFNPYDKGYIVKTPEGEQYLDRIPYIISQDNLTHTVKEGETIQSIAFQYYGDSGLWGLIADANKILNPFEELTTDRQIIIPVYGR